VDRQDSGMGISRAELFPAESVAAQLSQS